MPKVKISRTEALARVEKWARCRMQHPWNWDEAVIQKVNGTHIVELECQNCGRERLIDLRAYGNKRNRYRGGPADYSVPGFVASKEAALRAMFDIPGAAKGVKKRA